MLLLTRLIGLAMGLVVMVLAAKSLGPRRYGTFGFSLALVQIGMNVSDWGLGALLIREAATAPDQLRSLHAWCVGTRIVGGTAVASVLAVIAFLTVPAGEGRAAALLIIATLPISAFWLGQSVLQHFGLLRRLGGLALAQSIAWLAAVTVLATRHAGLFAFALAYLIYSVWYAAVVHLVARRSLASEGEVVGARPFARLLRGAIPLGATLVIIALYYRIDSIFVYRLSGAAAAGAYAVAYRFLDQAHALPITLCAVFLPLLSAERAAGRPTGPVFTAYLRVSLLTSVPSVALGVLLAEPIVIGVFGEEYRDSVVLLQLLLLSFVPIMIGYVLGQIAIVHHQSRRQLAAAIAALALNVILNTVFVPLYGPRAAAVITGLTELAVAACLYLTLRAPCGLRLPLPWIARLAAATLSASLVGFALARHPWAAGAAFVVCFAAAGTLLRLLDRSELQLLRPSAKRR